MQILISVYLSFYEQSVYPKKAVVQVTLFDYCVWLARLKNFPWTHWSRLCLISVWVMVSITFVVRVTLKMPFRNADYHNPLLLHHLGKIYSWRLDTNRKTSWDKRAHHYPYIWNGVSGGGTILLLIWNSFYTWGTSFRQVARSTVLTGIKSLTTCNNVLLTGQEHQ